MSTISFDSSFRPSSFRAAPSVDAAAAARPTVRLTRRGRLVLVGLVLGVVAALAVLLGPAVVATDSAGTAPAAHAVTVQPGMTLWSIAAEANPGGDVRDTVDDIVRLNALPNGSGLQLGTTLQVPDYR